LPQPAGGPFESLVAARRERQDPGVLERLLDYLREEEGPHTYLVLALTSFAEYVVPPLPGDVASLFGTFLAATAGYSVWAVYLSLVFGSTIGGVTVWQFGRAIGHHEDRWPKFLRGERTRRTIAGVRRRFEEHGGAYLVVNRFVPAIRSVFFLAAGLADVRLWKVVVFGGISAAVWNGLILAVGYAVGDNWDRLLALYEQYTVGVLALGVVVVLIVVGWKFFKRRRKDH
jgi:membrane protein DedA with SNARE-associated domain